jgi:hypothetical protein
MTGPNQRQWRTSAYLVTLFLMGSVIGVDRCLAQDDGLVTIDARRCIEIESPDERLACFEAQVKQPVKPQGATAPPAATGSAAAGSPAAPPTPQVESVRVPAQQARGDEASPTEWVGSITALQERVPRRWLITLDTGQIWEQQVAERYALRVGQRVRIYESRWGGHHRLEADGIKGFIQVDRVR